MPLRHDLSVLQVWADASAAQQRLCHRRSSFWVRGHTQSPRPSHAFLWLKNSIISFRRARKVRFSCPVSCFHSATSLEICLCPNSPKPSAHRPRAWFAPQVTHARKLKAESWKHQHYISVLLQRSRCFNSLAFCSASPHINNFQSWYLP